MWYILTGSASLYRNLTPSITYMYVHQIISVYRVSHYLQTCTIYYKKHANDNRLKGWISRSVLAIFRWDIRKISPRLFSQEILAKFPAAIYFVYSRMRYCEKSLLQDSYASEISLTLFTTMKRHKAFKQFMHRSAVRLTGY